MDSEIMVEALPLLGICNLCLNEGAVQSMLIAHKHNGSAEIYTDMLMKCFSIDVSIVLNNTFITLVIISITSLPSRKSVQHTKEHQQ